MRTKTLILSGVLAALTSASVMAQVYSLNAVGYINVDLPSQQFTIIADQLLYGGSGVLSNTFSPMLDSQLLTPAGAGITFYKWTGGPTGSYSPFSVNGQGTGWSTPQVTNITLNPGEAVFAYNPGADFTLTFVGTVPQGTLVNPYAATNGFSLIASIVPQAGTLDTNSVTGLGFAPNSFDDVYLFENGYTEYTANNSSGSLVWSSYPAVPTVAVGQGFFYYTTVTSGLPWTRTFNINQ